MLLYRAHNHIIAQDEKGRVTFDLQSKKQCDMLQALTKEGFDLVMERPYEILDVNTLVFLNDKPQ